MTKPTPASHNRLTNACTMLRALGHKVVSTTAGDAATDPEVKLADGRTVQVCAGGRFVLWGAFKDGAWATTDCDGTAALLAALKK